MALVSLEQRRQRERADEQANRIRQELAEYDLQHSRDPIDRRRAEKEAEARAQEAREVQEKQSAAQWWAAHDARVVKIIEAYCWKGDYGGGPGKGVLTDAIGSALAETRKQAEATVKKQFEKQFEEERRHFEARIAELEDRLKSAAAAFPIIKASWQPQSVTYKGELVAHKGSLFQARCDTAREPGRGSDWTLVARHGVDASTPCLRGVFDTHECYTQLDIVEYEGASYIAQRDNPPGIPGHDDGWQVFGSERKDLRVGQGGHRGGAAVGRCEARGTGASVE